MDLIIDQNRIRFSANPSPLLPETKTIIFLHDSLGCIELWRGFPKKLQALTKYNVLVYDRQGYGQSDPFSINKRETDYLKTEADLLGKILDQLQLHDVILFGHSDGGSIALLTAALYPEKIAGIITEGAHVFVEEETITGIQEAAMAYKHTNLKEKLTRYHGDKTEDVFTMWTRTWLSEEYQSWNIEAYLPKIICPSLIIQGEDDEYGTIKQVESIVKNTTGKAIPLLIKNVAHTPHKESPDVVLEHTIKFIKQYVDQT